ncbi:MAG: hypothetical protein ABSF29_12615, partial [Tepidisphaeraceae bacterium]
APYLEKPLTVEDLTGEGEEENTLDVDELLELEQRGIKIKRKTVPDAVLGAAVLGGAFGVRR